MKERFFYWRHKKCAVDIVDIPRNWPKVGLKCRVHRSVLVFTGGK